MTCIVSSGALNSTHSLTHSQKRCETDTLKSTLETCKGTEVNTVGKKVPAFNNTFTLTLTADSWPRRLSPRWSHTICLLTYL